MKLPFSKYNYNWQYTGIVPFDDIRTWCRDNFGPEGDTAGRWQAIWETIWFVNQKDYNWFMLRWS